MTEENENTVATYSRIGTRLRSEVGLTIGRNPISLMDRLFRPHTTRTRQLDKVMDITKIQKSFQIKIFL